MQYVYVILINIFFHIRKVSALDLFLEEHRADLQEEYPDLADEDLGQKATEAFRALDKEERQVSIVVKCVCNFNQI